MKKIFLLVLAGGFLLAGCVSNPYAVRRTVQGGAIGAGAGYVFGGGKGAALGSVAGATLGAIIGSIEDETRPQPVAVVGGVVNSGGYYGGYGPTVSLNPGSPFSSNCYHIEKVVNARARKLQIRTSANEVFDLQPGGQLDIQFPMEYYNKNVILTAVEVDERGNIMGVATKNLYIPQLSQYQRQSQGEWVVNYTQPLR